MCYPSCQKRIYDPLKVPSEPVESAVSKSNDIARIIIAVLVQIIYEL